LGYDINSESGSGKKLKGSFNSITDYAGFISLEISPNSKLSIKPGVRYSVNTVYKTSPLPSLNIKYVQKKGYTYRMSYARGFRAPDLKELYLYFVDVNHNVIGNPDLNPENSNNFQFAVNRKKVIKKIILQPEIAFFYNNIKQRIILTNVQDLTYTYKNLNNFQSFNSNLSLNFKAPQISGDFGYALNMISTSQKQLENAFASHEITANLIYQWKKPAINFAFFIKSTSKTVTFVLDEIGETKQGKTDGYIWMDLTCSKPFLNNKWIVAAGVKNLAGITNIQTTGNIGGVHSSGSNYLLFASGRIIFVKLDYYFVKK
jgi:outer membrane receptor for ferrienterochelin and colicins